MKNKTNQKTNNNQSCKITKTPSKMSKIILKTQKINVSKNQNSWGSLIWKIQKTDYNCNITLLGMYLKKSKIEIWPKGTPKHQKTIIKQ